MATAHPAAVEPVLAPLTSDEVTACLDGLLATMKKNSSSILDPAFLLLVRMALTAAQDTTGGSGKDAEVLRLRREAQRLQGLLTTAERQVERAAQGRATEARVAKTETAQATASTAALALVERALIEDGEGSLGNAVADEVRKTVNLLDASRKETLALQAATRLAQQRRQTAQDAQAIAEATLASTLAEAVEATDLKTALQREISGLSAHSNSLTTEVGELRLKVKEAGKMKRRAVSQAKSKVRDVSRAMFDSLAWTMSHPRYRLRNQRGRQVPVKCCPYCQGLSPEQAPSHPEKGHRKNCMLGQAQKSFEATFST